MIGVGHGAAEELSLNIRSIRPGYRLHPRHQGDILGTQVVRDIERGTLQSRDLVLNA